MPMAAGRIAKMCPAFVVKLSSCTPTSGDVLFCPGATYEIGRGGAWRSAGGKEHVLNGCPLWSGIVSDTMNGWFCLKFRTTGNSLSYLTDGEI